MFNCKCKKKDRNKSALSIADLQEQIRLQSYSDVNAVNGSITRTYSTDYTVWAKVAPIGQAIDSFQQTIDHQSYRIEILWETSMVAALKHYDRILLEDNTDLDIVRLEKYKPQKVVLVCNDYSGLIEEDGLTHDGNQYDVIRRNDFRSVDYTDAGLEKDLHTEVLVRISDFEPMFSAIHDDVTVGGEELRLFKIEKASRGNWAKLHLKRDFD